ncbi:MAG: hypothetical protein ACP5HK_04080 [Acidilobus sp.]
MLSMEEALYMSLGLGFLVGLIASVRDVRSSRALDVASTASILALVFSMGLVVGSEVISIRAQVGTIVISSVLLAFLPGLAGSFIGEAVVRRLERRA